MARLLARPGRAIPTAHFWTPPSTATRKARCIWGSRPTSSPSTRRFRRGPSCPQPGALTDPFGAVVGHGQALDQLRAQINSDRLAHAYLFVGESGLGKSATARALASALLPEAPLKRNPDYWEDDRIKPLSINEIRLLPDKPPEFHRSEERRVGK